MNVFLPHVSSKSLALSTVLGAITATLLWTSPADAASHGATITESVRTSASTEDEVRPNFKQARLFSSPYLRQRTYSTSVTPKWIGETDRFWYSYRTSGGTHYVLVDPEAKTKTPLFDHQRLASDLSLEMRKPLDSYNLSLSRAEIDDEGEKLTFVMDKKKFELDLTSGALVKQDETPEEETGRTRESRSSRGRSEPKEKDPRAHRNFSPDRTAYVFAQEHNLYFVEATDEVKAEIAAIEERMKKEKEEEKKAAEEETSKEDDSDQEDSKDGESEEEDSDKETSEKDDSKEGDSEQKDSDQTDTEEEDSVKEETEEDDSKEDDSEEGDSKDEDSDEKDEDSDEKDEDSDEKRDGEEGDEEKDDGADGDEEKEEEKVDERERWADDVDETQALRLTEDGEEDYEFSTGRGYGRGSVDEENEDAYLELVQTGEIGSFLREGDDDDDEKKDDEKKKDDKKNDEKKNDEKKDGKDGDTEEGEDGKEDGEEEDEEEEETKKRPRVSWAPDSTAFYATRRDSRDVEELFLVNSLSEPRPTLETYSYALPGEENVSTSELYVFDRTRKELFHVEGKWKDEGYQNLHWPKAPPSDSDDDDDEDAEEPDVTGSGDELRMIRRDRLVRNVEMCSINTRTSEVRVLLEDGFDGANISSKSVRYLKDRGEMIWWSERSGWGHYYLYGMDGEFKNAITSGVFRASQIVEVDQDKGLLYFRGNGREPGENVYYQHLYRVFLDGSGLTLMDPGDAYHRSVLSPTQNYLVDNCSRIDMAPVSRLCDADGNELMALEETDLSRLEEAGWEMPETFTFKAADGITDLYGNMWKPFDFDPAKRYPIIAEVYPGPQMEGVSHTFSASNARQQLAQIGFIVVQLGHRGGTPGRSKAYHSYGYFNLRDYGLADKKAGIEQLAERHDFIDVEHVGIYGHSGGGFMTAAALMQEPYNDFFKVGVSSSGNHDNNVYGSYWAERYHGLREVAVKEEKESKERGQERDESKDRAARDDDEKEKEDGEKDLNKEGEEGDQKKDDEEGEDEEEVERKTRFEIHVPTNAELAENLKGNLLLVHGDMDNNVHPAGTMRLVDALIKANKRFDMLIIPGKRHGYGEYSSYFTQRKWEFFAEHLLGDHQDGADIMEKEGS